MCSRRPSHRSRSSSIPPNASRLSKRVHATLEVGFARDMKRALVLASRAAACRTRANARARRARRALAGAASALPVRARSRPRRGRAAVDSRCRCRSAAQACAAVGSTARARRRPAAIARSVTSSSRSARAAAARAVPTMAVVSAMGGMTDLLIKVVDSALVRRRQGRSSCHRPPGRARRERRRPAITEAHREPHPQGRRDPRRAARRRVAPCRRLRWRWRAAAAAAAPAHGAAPGGSARTARGPHVRGHIYVTFGPPRVRWRGAACHSARVARSRVTGAARDLVGAELHAYLPPKSAPVRVARRARRPLVVVSESEGLGALGGSVATGGLASARGPGDGRLGDGTGAWRGRVRRNASARSTTPRRADPRRHRALSP